MCESKFTSTSIQNTLNKGRSLRLPLKQFEKGRVWNTDSLTYTKNMELQTFSCNLGN